MKKILFLMILIFCVQIHASDLGLFLKPPKADKKPYSFKLHGDTIEDDYFWLREKTNPKVIDYLTAENTYTDKITEATKPLQEKIFLEIKNRMKEDDETVPVRIGNFFYYSRTEAGKQYRIYCRKKDSLKNPEEILLNLNILAKDKEYLSLGSFRIHPSHDKLAYTLDTDGSENYTLYVKDLKTGKLISDKLFKVSSAEWSFDGKFIFYTIIDSAHRPYQLKLHTLGKEEKKDQILYEEKDAAFYLDLKKTKDKNYIILTSGSSISTESRIYDSSDPQKTAKIFLAREKDHEYSIFHHGKYFYIRTNYLARNFRLMRTLLEDTSRAKWEEVIPHREDTSLKNCEFFETFYTCQEKFNGLNQIRIGKYNSEEHSYIPFTESVYSVSLGNNPEFNQITLRYYYESLTTPESVYDYSIADNQSFLRKEQEIPGGYDKNLYQSERVFVRSTDGVNIPLSIVYKKGISKSGNNPLHLYAYGSYGSCVDPYFSITRISMLDRGYIYAIAHPRGSSTMGENWYHDGKLLNKRNTFLDFINCAEYLIREKYTSSDYLTIEGGSAGGLLIGAVVTMRPELFKGAIADVPFVDVINTMLDETLPLTVTEFDEWGNPKDKFSYDYMKTYCPYTNSAKKRPYPNILVLAGLNDPRVSYWEPAKWVCRMRENNTSSSLILLKTQMGAGHFGASGRYDAIKEYAFHLAYLFTLTGIDE